MSNSIEIRQGKYPTAHVPGAQSLGDVFAEWQERGFTPVEVTRDQVLQRIEIIHDPLKGELTWKTSGSLDGLGMTLLATQATMLMPAILTADGAMSICEYFTRGQGQLDLGTGEAAVMVAFKDGRLALDWQPKETPIAAKKLLAAALLFLLARDAGLPIERLAESLGV